MDNTSENKPAYDFANEVVTPFFTRAQLYAFSIPPSSKVIEQVNKGGQQDYIPHEYIRALLDRYIGPGRWEMRAALHSTDKEVVKKYDSRKKAEVENVAATANVNVTLVIHAQDGSDKTLEFSAVGSNTQYAGVDKGFGAIIGNAISSAESLGLKRAATNLGKAFGFDLRSKVKKEDMPATIADLAAQLNARYARSISSTVDQNAGTTQLEAPASSVDTSAPKTGEATTATQPEPTVTPKADPIPAKVETAAAAQVEPSKTAVPTEDTKPNPAAQPEQKPVEAAAAEPTAVADANPNVSKAPADFEPWELSVTPSRYEEWLVCIKTMAQRMANIANERELTSFIRRNDALIKKLPIIPAAGDAPERNFKRRWITIVNARCKDLNIPVPDGYKLETEMAPA